MKKWLYLIFLFGLFTVYGCTLTQPKSFTTDNPSTLITTTSNITSTSTTTTTQIPLSPIGEELRSKIYSFVTTPGESGYMQIDSVLKHTLNHNSLHLDVVHHQLNEVDIFNLNNLYYYGSYNDNYANEGWVLIEPDENSKLKLNINDNNHLMISSIDFSIDNLYNNSYNPYFYFTEIFKVAEFEKKDDSSYSITFPYKSIKDDPMFRVYFDNLLITDKNFNANGSVTIEYLFTESDLKMIASIIVPIEDSIADSLTVTLNSTVTFPESITPFTYNRSDYYLDSYDTIQSDMEIFEVGDSIKIFAHQDRINIVKFHLDPGYYSFGSFNPSFTLLDAFITDASGNRIDRNPYYKILVSGDYYYHFEDSENIYRDLRSSQLDPTQIGTIESPIISGPVLTGSIDVDSEFPANLHLLGDTSPGYVIKITPVSINSNYPYIISHGMKKSVSFDYPTYIVIEKDYTPIILVSSRNDCDYELAWEIVPFNTLETDIANMPSLPIVNGYGSINTQTPIAYLGNNSIETNLKFEIKEAGYYNIFIDYIDETGFLENYNSWPGGQIYNDKGELIDYAGPSVIYQYEPGTYYINLKWFEGEYVIIAGCVILTGN